MRLFDITKNHQIVCESENTRYGFRHVAHLTYNGVEYTKEKSCYYNRTWEAHEFDSVMLKLADKISKDEPAIAFAIKKFVRNR